MFKHESRTSSLAQTSICRTPISLILVAFAARLLFVSGLSPVLQAQMSTAAVVGTMTDSSGGAVAAVKMTATNIDTGLNYSGETNSSGDFVIPALPPGRYRIQGVLTGFRTWQIPEVMLAVR